MMKAKSETDEMIRKLNQQIVLEKEKNCLLNNSEKIQKILEQEFKMKGKKTWWIF